MNVRELRIGNWVNFCGSEKQIEGISIRQRPDCGYYQLQGQENWQKGIHLSPIPIREEWLVKFGFKYYNRQNHLADMYLNTGSLSFVFTKSTIDIGIEVEGQYLGTVIKYIHQLQNLYFSLTGEELEQP